MFSMMLSKFDGVVHRLPELHAGERIHYVTDRMALNTTRILESTAVDFDVVANPTSAPPTKIPSPALRRPQTNP